MHQFNINWEWHQSTSLKSKSYTCGYCGERISSQRGFTSVNHEALIYICHVCNRPTFFDPSGQQFPGVIYGEEVQEITSADVKNLYKEARACISVNAFTASVLCSRKLLMNIAVSKGANTGLSFAEYVDYLDTNNYIPPGSKNWVDHIRKQGNEATHEINEQAKEDAEELINFLTMLMKIIYEFPAIMKRKKT